MIRVHRLQLLGMVNARGKQVEVRFERSAGVAEVDRPAVGKLRFELSIRQKARKAIGLCLCGSAWKRDPGSGVIGVEKGPLIPVV